MLSLPPLFTMSQSFYFGEKMAADYAMAAELLAAHHISTPVAEIHGVLSGQMCADSRAFDLGAEFESAGNRERSGRSGR